MCVRGWSAANAVSVMHSPPFTSAVPAAVGETTGSRVPSPTVALDPLATVERRLAQRVQELTGGVGGRRVRLLRLDRVQRVALHERGVERGERVGIADVVDAR